MHENAILFVSTKKISQFTWELGTSWNPPISQPPSRRNSSDWCCSERERKIDLSHIIEPIRLEIKQQQQKKKTRSHKIELKSKNKWPSFHVLTLKHFYDWCTRCGTGHTPENSHVFLAYPALSIPWQNVVAGRSLPCSMPTYNIRFSTK